LKKQLQKTTFAASFCYDKQKNNLMKATACIFDLDGVIVDTRKYHYKAWKRLATAMTIDFTEAENERLKGVSRMDSLNLILGWGNLEADEPTKDELARRKNEWFLEYLQEMTPKEILKGVVPLLRDIRKAGVKIALASPSKNAIFMLDKIQLLPYFDAIVDGNNLLQNKPDPALFLKAAHALGVSPKTCMVFENTVTGIEAGVSAGMRTVGVGDAKILREADLVLPDFEYITYNEIAEALSMNV
jgi:beta-phosphoglucomutase